MWHIRVVLKAEFSDNNRAAAVSISLDAAEIRFSSWPVLASCRAPAERPSACGCERWKTSLRIAFMWKTRYVIAGLQLVTGSRKQNNWILINNNLLFHYYTEPHPVLSIPAGCSGRVQMVAGSSEHRDKHLSPSEPDPQSRRVDWVHRSLLWIKSYDAWAANIGAFSKIITTWSALKVAETKWTTRTHAHTHTHTHTHTLRLCLPLFFHTRTYFKHEVKEDQQRPFY